MGERRGTKALEVWCKRMTEGYPGVKVENMTTSWRDGLAFCAMIHHFRPDLIDFNSLNKNDIYRNNELAFRIAEHHLGIPALLDAEDMVEYAVPDRLSILTYLSQYYQKFGSQGASPTRLMAKRSSTVVADRGIVSPTSSTPPTKMATLQGGGISRRDPCQKCGLPVFLAERLNVDNHLYHRTCFRCARCSHQLSLANYYETEDGEFCCETCPDEVPAITKHENVSGYQQNVLTQSLSDEEKEQGLNKDLSIQIVDKSLHKVYSYEKFMNARSNFVGSQLSLSTMDTSVDTEGEPPDLPTTKPPDKNLTDSEMTTKLFVDSTNLVQSDDETIYSFDKISSGLGSMNADGFQTQESLPSSHEFYVENVIHDDSGASLTTVELSNKEQEDNRNSVRDDLKDIVNINSTNSVKYNSDSINQPLATDIKSLEALDRTNNTEFVTKDEESNTVTDNSALESLADASNLSLLKSRTHQPTITFDVKEDYENEENIPVVVTAMNSELIKKYNDVPFDEYDKPIAEECCDFSNTDSTSVVRSQTQISNSAKQLDNSNNIPLTIEHEGIKSDINEILVDKNVIAVKEDDYPEELNPFEEDDVLEDVLDKTPTNKADSTNPFGSDIEDDGDNDKREENKSVASHGKFSASPRKKLNAPRMSLNPFLSEDEDDSTDEAKVYSKPVPKPRSILLDQKKTPEPTPRIQNLGTTPGFHGSTTSLESVKSGKTALYSPGGTYKKKKAPPPPSSKSFFTSTENSTDKSHATIPPVKLRKSRPAPAPPTALANKTSASIPPTTITEKHLVTESPFSIIAQKADSESECTSLQESPAKSTNSELEKEKNTKDEKNRNRQSMTLGPSQQPSTNVSPESEEVSLNLSPPNKSTFGKWKRKKGPAPPRPVPQRRQINILPATELRRQLDIIEIQQQGLEKQGVKLEQLIRDKSEMPGINEDSSLTQEVEDLVLQLFELVNEKNELFRKQAELMYLRRQQRLEEEHADLEYQIRCLMERPEINKTDYDKAKEEELINRLIEVVETRNEIIECLEMDRIREAEEDESISTHLNLYASKRDEDLLSVTSSQESTKLSKKEKKKQKKIKKTKGVTIDADKDVDETEVVQKEKKKKKWLFNV